MVIAAGEGVGIGLLIAISSPTCPSDRLLGRGARRGRAGARRSPLWILVALICAAASVAGYGIADSVSGDLQRRWHRFAAGALLVMLDRSMIPDTVEKAAWGVRRRVRRFVVERETAQTAG